MLEIRLRVFSSVFMLRIVRSGLLDQQPDASSPTPVATTLFDTYW